MSKKMLKRSLALGALMAFVITGSAMAAVPTDVTEATLDTSNNRYYGIRLQTGTESATIGAASYIVDVQSDATNSGVFAFQLDSNGTKLTFTDNATFSATTNTSGTGNNQLTALSVYDGQVIVKGNVAATANATGANGKSAYGISVYGGGTAAPIASFEGDSVTVTVTTETARNGVGTDYSEAAGVNVIEGTLITSENTDTTIDVTGTNTTQNAAPVYGVLTEAGSATFGGTTEITVTSAAASAYGVKVIDGYYTSSQSGDDSANASFNNVNITVENTNEDGYAAGMYACERKVGNETSQIDVSGDAEITVIAGGEAYGVLSGKRGAGNATINLGTEKDESVIKVNVTAKDATGIMARGQNGSSAEGSVLNVNGSLLDITVTGQGAGAYGIYVANGTDGAEDDVETTNVNECQPGLTQVNINTETTKIVAKGTTNEIGTMGIMNVSQGSLNINSNLEVTADNVLVTRGKAVTNINVDKDGNAVLGKSTVLTGNIAFDYDEDTSGSAIDTTVNISLDGTGSSWTGNTVVYKDNVLVTERAFDENGNIVCGDPNLFTVSNFNLDVSNGANWTTDSNSFVNKLTVGGSDASLNLVGDSAHTVLISDATFKDGSKLYIKNGENYLKDTGNYALEVGKLTVENGAKIEIGGVAAGNIYNVVKGTAENLDDENEGFWTLEAENKLLQAEWNDVNGNLQATISAKAGEELVSSGVATNENQEILSAIAEAETDDNATVNAINELASNDNVSNEDIQKGAAALLQVAEAGGFTGNVISVSKQVNGSVGARNSFAGPKHGGPRHRGGHGPSVSEEANGSAIWAQYVHGKDKVDGIDMGGTENAYESQFNGVVLGADFKQVGSYASGIAFNYGEGDSHSKKNVVQSDSEFDFWGVSYYGAVKKQDTNFIFDIGYSESDSDVEQKFGSNTITASPEASTWTAGVKVEKLIDKGAVQIVPYAGLRFMTIDTDDYEAKGATASEATYYSTERQDIWLLPVGVSLSQENVYDSGWIVTPKADFSYTWAMGDTDSSMTVNIPNVASDTLGYTVMDDGSFMATVGLDAQKEDWTFGVAYSYQKGDSTRSDRWYVNARYSF